jgi:UDP-hydrolysing UDP-N-acetyl-D-glucosamine 2-epimerase
MDAAASRRKICVVVINRANYGRIKTVLEAVQAHPQLELQLVAGSSLLHERHGRAIDVIRKDGFDVAAEVYMTVEGEAPLTMAKTVGLGIVELTSVFHRLQPDFVLVVADRFEIMSAAIAASYMNIPLAHTQGGEVTGSIDESVRHAVTKLAHLHFPATELSRERVLRMGEDPARVFNTGCPSIDIVARMDLSFTPDDLAHLSYAGVGASIDVARPYVLMLQHPVTTEHADGAAQVMETIHAVQDVGLPTVALWPNIDAGSDGVSKAMRMFREANPEAAVRFYKNFSPELYYKLIANAKCCVGNSSSFIREGSYLGAPAVLVGRRQQGREHGLNARFDVPHDRAQIAEAMRAQIAHGRYEPDTIFGDGTAGRKIADLLATAAVDVQKRLAY